MAIMTRSRRATVSNRPLAKKRRTVQQGAEAENSSQLEIFAPFENLLPPELIVEILSHLSQRDLCRMEQCCQKLHACAQIAWRNAYPHKSLLHRPVQEHIHWKTLVLERAELENRCVKADAELATLLDNNWLFLSTFGSGQRELKLQTMIVALQIYPPSNAHRRLEVEAAICLAQKRQLEAMQRYDQLLQEGGSLSDDVFPIAARSRMPIDFVASLPDPSTATMERAMHGAASSGYVEMMQHLHARGASLDPRSSPAQGPPWIGLSVATVAAMRGQISVLEYLRHEQAITFDKEILRRCLGGVTGTDTSTMVGYLLALDPNVEDLVLRAAIDGCNLRSLSALVEQRPNLVNDFARRHKAYIVSSNSPHYMIHFFQARLGEECRHWFYMPDAQGRTIFHTIAARGNTRLMAGMKPTAEDLSVTDDDGLTPLDIAIDRGYERLAKWLRFKSPSKSTSTHNLRPRKAR